MERFDIVLKSVGGVLASLCTFLWGGPDAWLYAMLGFIVFDYITGVAAAYMEGTLSSKKGFQGIVKKVVMLIPVAVANMIDNAVGAGGVLRSATVGFMAANEGLSVLENCARCGVPVFKGLAGKLEQLRGKDTEGK